MKKRGLALVLILVMALALLAGCGKSEAVENAEGEISAIGAVDESSLRAIEEAEAAYGALSEKEQSKVENRGELERARAEYDALMAGKVDALIAQLGDIDSGSGGAIENAELAYNALSEAQKDLVSGYGALRTARDRYDALCATAVESLIQSVRWDGTSEPTAELQDSIAAAQTAYDALTEAQRAAVRNYGDLEEIGAAVTRWAVERVQSALDAAVAEDGGYAEADALYQTLTAEQQGKIEGYDEFSARWEDYQNRPPVALLGYSLSKNIISNPEISIRAENTSDKVIKEFSMSVFAYDDDGLPVKVRFNHYSSLLSYSDALKAGESVKSGTRWTLYGDYNEIRQVVVILRRAEFFDGTTWENPQYDALCGKYEQQMLEAGDENILPRG